MSVVQYPLFSEYDSIILNHVEGFSEGRDGLGVCLFSSSALLSALESLADELMFEIDPRFFGASFKGYQC